MPTFKNTLDIMTNPWNEGFSCSNASARMLPSKNKWTKKEEITIQDVILWEQIYYEAGNVGIYAAYNPYAEFYIITYNLFLDSDNRFETFSGETAAQDCYDRAVKLGIKLNFT
jgi:hypothetical protein